MKARFDDWVRIVAVALEAIRATVVGGAERLRLALKRK
jgi:hypothetical protein